MRKKDAKGAFWKHFKNSRKRVGSLKPKKLPNYFKAFFKVLKISKHVAKAMSKGNKNKSKSVTSAPKLRWDIFIAFCVILYFFFLGQCRRQNYQKMSLGPQRASKNVLPRRGLWSPVARWPQAGCQCQNNRRIKHQGLLSGSNAPWAEALAFFFLFRF